jgi:hypothetical protein
MTPQLIFNMLNTCIPFTPTDPRPPSSEIKNLVHLQVGFAVAVWAEIALPQGGLFGAWGSDNYNTLMGASAALIAGAVVSTCRLDLPSENSSALRKSVFEELARTIPTWPHG